MIIEQGGDVSGLRLSDYRLPVFNTLAMLVHGICRTHILPEWVVDDRRCALVVIHTPMLSKN